jgi:hypothetical protein
MMEISQGLIVFLTLLGIIYAVLMFLIPFFIYRIRNESITTNRMLSDISGNLRIISDSLQAKYPNTASKKRVLNGFNSLVLIDYETAKNTKTGEIYKGSFNYDRDRDRWELNIKNK